MEEKLCEWLVEGAKLNEVYDKAVAMVKKEQPDLVDKLTKNFGFLMGIELREPSLSIAPNCTATLKKGMVFNLNVGLSGLTNNQVAQTFFYVVYTSISEIKIRERILQLLPNIKDFTQNCTQLNFPF